MPGFPNFKTFFFFPRSDDNSKSSISEENPKIGAFVNSRRESMARSDTDQLIPSVPFGSLLSAKTLLQQSPTNAVSGNEFCERLKTIELDKEDANENIPVAKSVSSCNDDFIVVDLVVRLLLLIIISYSERGSGIERSR